MAKTLLNACNEILKRTSVIGGDAGALTTLTDSARQGSIDTAVQVINEGIIELYAAGNIELPNEQAEASLTLVTSTRAYTLATSPAVVQLRWPMIDRTNNQFLNEYPGGYNAMLIGDIEQDDTGLPHFAAIRPTDGKLYLDSAPTAAENGRIYTYQYDKDVTMALAADTVPFNDTVFKAMVPVWVQLWKRERRNEFDTALYNKHLGLASALMTQRQPRSDYNPR